MDPSSLVLTRHFLLPSATLNTHSSYGGQSLPALERLNAVDFAQCLLQQVIGGKQATILADPGLSMFPGIRLQLKQTFLTDAPEDTFLSFRQAAVTPNALHVIFAVNEGDMLFSCPYLLGGNADYYLPYRPPSRDPILFHFKYEFYPAPRPAVDALDAESDALTESEVDHGDLEPIASFVGTCCPSPAVLINDIEILLSGSLNCYFGSVLLDFLPNNYNQDDSVVVLSRQTDKRNKAECDLVLHLRDFSRAVLSHRFVGENAMGESIVIYFPNDHQPELARFLPAEALALDAPAAISEMYAHRGFITLDQDELADLEALILQSIRESLKDEFPAINGLSQFTVEITAGWRDYKQLPGDLLEHCELLVIIMDGAGGLVSAWNGDILPSDEPSGVLFTYERSLNRPTNLLAKALFSGSFHSGVGVNHWEKTEIYPNSILLPLSIIRDQLDILIANPKESVFYPWLASKIAEHENISEDHVAPFSFVHLAYNETDSTQEYRQLALLVASGKKHYLFALNISALGIIDINYPAFGLSLLATYLNP